MGISDSRTDRLTELERLASKDWTTANGTQVLIDGGELLPGHVGVRYTILNLPKESDAALIVASRNALPALLEVVRAAHSVVDSYGFEEETAIATEQLGAALSALEGDTGT